MLLSISSPFLGQLQALDHQRSSLRPHVGQNTPACQLTILPNAPQCCRTTTTDFILCLKQSVQSNTPPPIAPAGPWNNVHCVPATARSQRPRRSGMDLAYGPVNRIKLYRFDCPPPSVIFNIARNDLLHKSSLQY